MTKDYELLGKHFQVEVFKKKEKGNADFRETIQADEPLKAVEKMIAYIDAKYEAPQIEDLHMARVCPVYIDEFGLLQTEGVKDTILLYRTKD